jgi:hypothetical protein
MDAYREITDHACDSLFDAKQFAVMLGRELMEQGIEIA